MASDLLSVQGLRAGYGETEVLRGVDLSVGAGEIVAVLGSNGVGKSTLNRTLSGVVVARAGVIQFDGAAIEREQSPAIVARGLIHVPEGRRIFPNMTVSENLDLGSYRRATAHRAENRERVYGVFPRLRERAGQYAGTLSGGEQQMLAIARALMARPKLIMMDEPSMGLAPLIVRDIFGIIRKLREEGNTVLLVEQNAKAALRIADRGYVLETGRVMLEGTAEDLLMNREVQRAYLGRDLDTETKI